MLHANQHPPRQKAAADRVYPVFHVFRGGQPDLSALSGGTGRHPPLAGLCRVCRQRHRPAHCRRGGRGQSGRVRPAGQPGPPEIFPRVHHSGLSLHRAMPRHPPHGQHLVCHAHSAGGGSLVAPMGLLRPLLCGSILDRAPSGTAHPAAGPGALPGPASPHPAAVCRVSVPPGGGRLQLTPSCPQRRASWTATRPWTPWPDSTSASSSP